MKIVFDIIASIVGNPGMGGAFPPGDVSIPARGPVQQVPATPPAVGLVNQQGPVLTGDALANANVVASKYKEILYWMGDVSLATKYGVPTEFPVLTPVEQDQWNRNVGAWKYFFERAATLGLIAPIPPDVATEPDAATGSPSAARVTPGVDSVKAPQQVAIGFKTIVDDAVGNLPPEVAAEMEKASAGLYKSLSPEQRVLLEKMLNGQ